MLPSLTDLVSTARVVRIPLATTFRGIDFREAVLFEGPRGWSEFSPFLEYDDTEAATWLAGAVSFAYDPEPVRLRDSVSVNATLPAVGTGEVDEILDRFGPCRTVKIKVAERGQTIEDDVERVAATRARMGPAGRIRIDANGGWGVDEAEHAIHALAHYDLEYVEQPCASVPELADIRHRVKHLGIPIAADESVRKAADPLAVARAGAADILVIKAQPLGGISAAQRIVASAWLPAVVSSALETSVGISMGLHLAAALPTQEFDCGLATVALLESDVTNSPLIPEHGELEVRRVIPDAAMLQRLAASTPRTEWWLERLERCYAIATATATGTVAHL
jgi:O-succinylbenzoate synthase